MLACAQTMLRYAYALALVLFIAPAFAGSTCFGTTANGRLSEGLQLPQSGSNYESYSKLARFAGRTYVHSVVHAIVVDAYHALENSHPGKVFKYAETGFASGGEFKPHKTHQNGLSIDFIVPVVDASGVSVHLPTHALNKYGYDIEFDLESQYRHYEIDYESMSAHIVELHKSALRSGHDLWRVIFDPVLQANLFASKYGKYLKENVAFSTKRSWVRHDEHYHVDFSLPCESAS